MSNILEKPVVISVHSYKNVVDDLLSLMGISKANYFSDVDINNYLDTNFKQEVIVGEAYDDIDSYKQLFKHGVMIVKFNNVVIASVYKLEDGEEDIIYSNDLQDVIETLYLDLIKISKKWFYSAFSRFGTSKNLSIYTAYSEYCIATNQKESYDIEKYIDDEGF